MEAKKKTGFSRAEMRRTYVKVAGKRIKLTEYIKSVSAILPPLRNKDVKGNPIINHRIEMQAMYRESGLQGIERYLQAVNEIVAKNEQEQKEYQP